MALYLRGKKREGVKFQAYLYKWTHRTTNMWYVGSRITLGCNPDNEYICSSRTVTPLSLQSEYK